MISPIDELFAIMGTRGLLGHIIKGKKRATYNHFDSYPSGLGNDLVAFIKSLTPEQIEKMKEMLEGIEW